MINFADLLNVAGPVASLSHYHRKSISGLHRTVRSLRPECRQAFYLSTCRFSSHYVAWFGATVVSNNSVAVRSAAPAPRRKTRRCPPPVCPTCQMPRERQQSLGAKTHSVWYVGTTVHYTWSVSPSLSLYTSYLGSTKIQSRHTVHSCSYIGMETPLTRPCFRTPLFAANQVSGLVICLAVTLLAVFEAQACAVRSLTWAKDGPVVL